MDSSHDEALWVQNLQMTAGKICPTVSADVGQLLNYCTTIFLTVKEELYH